MYGVYTRTYVLVNRSEAAYIPSLKRRGFTRPLIKEGSAEVMASTPAEMLTETVSTNLYIWYFAVWPQLYQIR